VFNDIVPRVSNDSELIW